MLKSYRVGWWGGVVAHAILMSAQVLLVVTLGLWDFGTLDSGLTIVISCRSQKQAGKKYFGWTCGFARTEAWTCTRN